MPSPIAHGSIALAGWPALRDRMGPEPSPAARRTLVLILIFSCFAPDLDLLIDPLLGNGRFANHGGPSHSLVVVAMYAAVVAFFGKAFFGLGVRYTAAVAVIGAGSHVLMDALTSGRGVMLLWPFIDDRIASPVPVFYGVEWSEPGAWGKHLITLSTELLFAAVVFFGARLLARRKEAA